MRGLMLLSCLCGKPQAAASSWLAQVSMKSVNQGKTWLHPEIRLCILHLVLCGSGCWLGGFATSGLSSASLFSLVLVHMLS